MRQQHLIVLGLAVLVALGAAGLGDIGRHFPPTDPQWKGAESHIFLAHAAGLARSMGYQGDNKGLLNAETNLKYAVKYLRGAYLVADKNHDQAVRLYARGYYFDAKRKGMLDVLK